VFVVFGWLKENRPLREVLDAYCYVCQRTSSWALWRETEWVTLFGMRTLPFLSKDAIACAHCGDHSPLERAHAADLLKGEQLQRTRAFLEEFQLASKTEVQRNFLRSTRAGREGGHL